MGLSCSAKNSQWLRPKTSKASASIETASGVHAKPVPLAPETAVTSAAVVAAVAKAAKTEEVAEEELLKCEVTKLAITCSHGHREPAAVDGETLPVLHVISSNNNPSGIDTVKMFTAGSCAHSKPSTSSLSANASLLERGKAGEQCPRIMVKSSKNNANINLPGTAALPLMMDALTPQGNFYRDNNGVFDLLGMLFKGSKDYTECYTVSTHTCEGTATPAAKIYATPPVSFTVNAGFGPKNKKQTEKQATENGIGLFESKNTSPYKNITNVGRWQFGSQIKGKFDTYELELKHNTQEGPVKNIMDLLSGFNTLIDFFTKAEDAESKVREGETTGIEPIRNHDGKGILKEKKDIKKRWKLFTLDFKEPNIQLGYQFNNAESDVAGKEHLLKETTTVKLHCNPLFQADFNVDILLLLVSVATGGLAVAGTTAVENGGDFARFISNVMDKIKRHNQGDEVDEDSDDVSEGMFSRFKRYAKNFGNKLSGLEAEDVMSATKGGLEKDNVKFNAQIGIDLKVSGTIAPKLQWSKTNFQKEGECIGSNESSVAIEVEGKALFEGTFFMVTFGAGAGFKSTSEKGDGPSAFKNEMILSGEYGLDFDCKNTFTGLAIEFMAFVTCGVSSKESNKAKASDGRGGMNSTSNDTGAELKEKNERTKRAVTFFKEKKWPQEESNDKPQPINFVSKV